MMRAGKNFKGRSEVQSTCQIREGNEGIQKDRKIEHDISSEMFETATWRYMMSWAKCQSPQKTFELQAFLHLLEGRSKKGAGALTAGSGSANADCGISIPSAPTVRALAPALLKKFLLPKDNAASSAITIRIACVNPQLIMHPQRQS